MTGIDLRVYRVRLQLKQSEIADMLGIARSYVSMMETGDRPIPAAIAKRVEAIAKMKGVK
jgi:transcriptional regulator with XRE-family HTH domain